MAAFGQPLIPPNANQKCVPPHWDASMIYRYTVPQRPSIALPVDPRPYAKICLEYRTSAEFLPAPPVPKDMVFTGASEFYPPTRYSANIDKESVLERLDRPLVRDPLPQDCPGVPNYVPPFDGDMFQQRVLLPRSTGQPYNDIARDLAYPPVLRNMQTYKCMAEAFKCDTAYNKDTWFNATRMQKYNQRSEPCGSRFGYVNGVPASEANPPRVHAVQTPDGTP